ncbi:hypothetical protein SAMN02745248_00435 [Hathewaya proteolytica DSM 3090]|uniref:Lipoprotein n=1 Tax=Hathewaya proteolytica DSM 3090 TaxID=1121331 RepID=A0A1M6KDX8_9CLOT|nr:hypothetical protein [Hathewaya proteolytica]SHJ57175.1 hypothetical protein SAMN02745248_00435 [Hathewaya proteolytica DSM 3090]
MKKIVIIVLILMSCFLIGCSLSDNDEPKKTLNMSEIILSYQVENFSYPEFNYAYVVNGYGDVKKISLVDKKKDEEYYDSYLQECMQSSDVPIVANVGIIPDDILDKIKKISEVKLKGKMLNVNFIVDPGARKYLCAMGNDTGRLILLQELGQMEYTSDDKNVKAVCRYIDEIKYLLTK